MAPISKLEKFERILFYPVLLLATILALRTLSEGIEPLSLISNAVVALLWILPMAPASFQPLRRIIFWIVIFVLILLGLYMAAILRQSAF